MHILKLLICLLVALLNSLSAQSDTTDSSDGFVEFMSTYGKSYNTIEEFNKRFSIWQEAVKLIQRHNRMAEQDLVSYTLGMNQFGDMTNEEFRSTMLGYKYNSDRPRNHGTKALPLSSLPDSVDWRAKGYVTEVGNQGQCGSCWAFTATGALEGAHKMKTGKLVDLSEQNLMDCSAKEGNYGCEGGFMDAAFKYVQKNGGIDTEQSYPYNQTNPGAYKCRYSKADSGASCTGFVDLPKGNETALQQAVAEIGPIASALDASHESFQFYKSGVYDEPKCNPQAIDHSLVIVGYGTESGKDYYDCKNSWGTSWGDKGFVKVVRNKNNQCGIANEASYPTE